MSDVLMSKSPAAWYRDLWREAYPSGNGEVAMLAYGHVADETVIINHSALWHHSYKMEVPQLHGALERTRKMMDEGDLWNANWIITNEVKEQGYKAALGAPFPVCALRFGLNQYGAFSHYRRYLHMDRGEIEVQWNDGDNVTRRQGFVSRDKDVVVWKVRSESKPLDMTVRLALHETGEDDVERKRQELGDSLKVYSEGNYIFYAGTNDDGTDFGAVARVVGEAEPNGKGGLQVTNTYEVMVLVKVFVKSTDRKQSFAQLKSELAAMTESYDELLEAHRKLHETLYRSAELKLAEEPELVNAYNEHLLEEAFDDGAPNVLLNKLWKFGRYLMICGTRPGALPFPLYGIYHGRYSMAWPHNMANENTQMTYWHVLGGGLTSLYEPLIDYYLGFLDQYRDNARKLFELPGIYMPAGTTPGNAVPNQVVPVIMNWIGCAGWIAQHFYSYYQYTGDEKLLKEKIMPFMKEAADFYEAYLVKGQDGTYVIYPSVSPENTPKSLMPSEEWEDLAHPCPSAYNATMDIAVIKELLMNLCEGAQLTGLYEEKIADWQEIIAHLPAYEATDDGDMKEWQWPGLTQRYNHRHLSHIYPMFPGREIVKGVAPAELTAQFEKAVDKRLLGAQTGWSLAHMAAIYARFERPEAALSSLDIMCRACLTKSFFTLHNDWKSMGLTLFTQNGAFAPIQLDASMGVVGAMQEMLLFAQPECVKLLPALPKRWSKGYTRLRYMQGEVEMRWNSDADELEITFRPTRPANVQVILPEKWAEGLRMNDGEAFVNGSVLDLSQMLILKK